MLVTYVSKSPSGHRGFTANYEGTVIKSRNTFKLLIYEFIIWIVCLEQNDLILRDEIEYTQTQFLTQPLNHLGNG